MEYNIYTGVVPGSEVEANDRVGYVLKIYFNKGKIKYDIIFKDKLEEMEREQFKLNYYVAKSLDEINERLNSNKIISDYTRGYKECYEDLDSILKIIISDPKTPEILGKELKEHLCYYGIRATVDKYSSYYSSDKNKNYSNDIIFTEHDKLILDENDKEK